MTEGITVRHARSCTIRETGRCNCAPTYQGQVYSRRERRRISRTFDTRAAAVAWRDDARVGLRRGTMPIGRTVTLHQAAREWLEGARSGLIRNRSGDRYKPSTLRGYDQALQLRVLPMLGAVKLTDLRRGDVARLISHLAKKDLDPSTIRNTLLPLRAIYRRAIALEEVGFNPTQGLELPAVRGRRDRIVSPDEAAKLLKRLDKDDRPLWATALYTGLRHGELRALRWEDVDLATGLIEVRRTWDHIDGPVEPKSAAGRRKVPIPAILRDTLLEHRLTAGRKTGLVFGRDAERPFSSSAINDRANRIWGKALRLHEARHSFASFMIAAGVNVKALSTFMGHASITITLDRYGHLMPGSEDEAAERLDAYLERATSEARKAAVSA